MSFRIDFKILLITFKGYVWFGTSLNIRATFCLRSSGKTLLSGPKSQLKAKGDHGFSVEAPKRWKTLPEEIRHGESGYKSTLTPDLEALILFYYSGLT